MDTYPGIMVATDDKIYQPMGYVPTNIPLSMVGLCKIRRNMLD